MKNHASGFRVATGVCALGVLSIAGCVDSNSRESIGREVVLGSLSSADTPNIETAATGGVDDAPSLTSLSRANWPISTFLVPVDGTHHRPNYTSNLRWTHAIARQRNEHPTVDSALDLDRSSSDPEGAPADRVGETLIAPILAFGEAALILPRLVIEPQCREVWSPNESYPRVNSYWRTAAESLTPAVSAPMPGGQ